jgi:IPTL-CTERM motif
MKFNVLILTQVLFFIFSLSSTEVKAQVTITDSEPSNIINSAIDNGADAFQLDGLTIFSNESQFNSICPSLPLEDFGNTNLPPNSLAACPSPFNSLTNNGCFSPGALIDGFSLRAIPVVGDGSLAVFTPPFLGNTNVLVGPNYLEDNSEFTFLNGGAGAVGVEIFGYFGATSVQIDIFGPGDILLGTTIVAIPGNGAFFGVISNNPITRITFTNGAVELFTNLSFGDCTIARNIPTVSEWGLIAMASILGIVGFMVIRRRKVTA